MRRILLFGLLAVFWSQSAWAQFPRILDFSPRRGTPGTVVFIQGQNLGEVFEVMMGMGPAQILQRSANLLTVVVPPDATIGPIVVYSDRGQDITPINFQVSPRISSFERITPQPQTPEDKVRGIPGNVVMIQGFNFHDPTDPHFQLAVTFGGVPASVQGGSDSQILVTVPNGAVSGPIVVSNSAGGWITEDFFYLQPIVSSVEPSRARVGDLINLRGVSLLGTTSVLFGSTSVTPETVQSTNVIVRVPPINGDVRLTLTSPGGSFQVSSNLVLAPKIDSFSPQGGAVGSWVTLDGSGLAGVNSASIGGVISSGMSNISSVRFSFRVPQGAVTGPIRVISPGGTNTTETPFYVAPTLTQFTPTSGQTGAVVRLTGLNFTGASQVHFGDVPALFTVVGNTQIDAIVPTQAQSSRIRITTPGGEVLSSSNFQVLGGEPILSTFSPTFGPPGTQVHIQGLNLGQVTEVRFGGVPSSSVTLEGETSLRATVPATAQNGPITLVNPLGSTTSVTQFLVGSSADVGVVMDVLPDEALVGDVLELSVRVRNHGPLPAQSVALGVTIPSGTELVDAFSSHGEPTVVGLGISFAIGNMSPGELITGHMQLRVLREGRFESFAELTTSSLDTNPDNDTDSVVFHGRSPALSLVRDSQGRFFLRWPASPDSLRVAFRNSLTEGTWTVIPDPAPIVGELRQWEITPDESHQWYRLESLSNP